jgi:hypothetical protein
MEALSENIVSIISMVFGAGGIGYAIISRFLDRKRYEQEVRTASVEADMKNDDFWKNRYDVLQSEVENKDKWWKDRYNTLYDEFQNERRLSNEIVKSFRTELNEMRDEYDKQREVEKMKYDKLLEQYKSFEEESQRREQEYKQRIVQLENIVAGYEQRLSKNGKK